MVKCLNIGKNIGKPIYRSISNHEPIIMHVHLFHVSLMLGNGFHLCFRNLMKFNIIILGLIKRKKLCKLQLY